MEETGFWLVPFISIIILPPYQFVPVFKQSFSFSTQSCSLYIRPVGVSLRAFIVERCTIYVSLWGSPVFQDCVPVEALTRFVLFHSCNYSALLLLSAHVGLCISLLFADGLWVICSRKWAVTSLLIIVPRLFNYLLTHTYQISQSHDSNSVHLSM